MSKMLPLLVILVLLALSSASLSSAEQQHSTTADCRSRKSGLPFDFMSRLPGDKNNVCIDQYEAAVLYYDDSHEWKLHPFNYPVDTIVSQNIPIKAVSSRDSRVLTNSFKPQAYISQVQAKLACSKAGKRLCSSSEFLLGCGGSQNLLYPYGEKYIEGICNVNHMPSPIQVLFGANATYNFTEMNDPRCDLLPNTLTAGGKYSKCTNNETGTFDLAGNLDEWVSDIQPDGRGIFRGGYFVLDDLPKYNGDGCQYITTAHDVTYHDYSLGFRCCADVY